MIRVHSRPHRSEVLLERSAVDRRVLAGRQGVEQLQHLQKEAHPLLLVVAQLRARSVRPDECAVRTQKTVVGATALDADADAKLQACERSVPASKLWVQRRLERMPLGECERRFLRAFLVVTVDLLE